MSEKREDPFAPIRINIAEEEGWHKYDTAHGGLDWLSDSGWDEFSNMGLRTLKDLIEDIATQPKKGKKRLKLRFSPEQVEYLAEQLKEGNDQLEITKMMITDAAGWMYEAAAIPRDGDIEEAMGKAQEDFNEGRDLYGDPWEPILDENVRKGPKEWSPIKRYSSNEIYDRLLERISFERKGNHFDRYLIFDFWNAPVIQTLFSRWKGSPWAYDRLKTEFKDLADGYVSDMFKHLEEIMRHIDINNRADWSDSWKSMLLSGEAAGAQKELVEVAKEMPEGHEEHYA